MLGRWQVEDRQSVRVPLPLSAGYHTLTLAVEPPCPLVYNEALRCLALEVDAMSLGELAPGELTPVPYAHGVTLAAAQVAPREGTRLPVWLWWQFSARRSDDDIRFVHVLNETGTLVAQLDGTLGSRETGDGLAEAVELELPRDLPQGTYSVYTGWYRFSDGV